MLGRTDRADLEHVVHHAQHVEALLLGRHRHPGQVGAQLRRPSRPGEAGHVQAEFHGDPPSAGSPLTLGDPRPGPDGPDGGSAGDAHVGEGDRDVVGDCGLRRGFGHELDHRRSDPSRSSW